MTLSVEERANSGFTVDESGTHRVAGIELEKVTGLVCDDADPVGLTFDDLRLLEAMGDSNDLRPAERRARTVLTPTERDALDSRDESAVSHLEAHGIDVDEFESVGDLAVAVDNIRRKRYAEVSR